MMTTLTLARPAHGRGSRELKILSVPGIRPDGRLPLALLDNPVEVRIPKSSDFFAGHRLQLYVGGHEPANAYGQPYYVTQQDLDDAGVTYLSLYIEPADFPPQGSTATWVLDYETYDDLAGSGQFSLLPLTVIFDREAPGGNHPNALEFSEQQLSGITDADLVNDRLPVLLSPWHGGWTGDYAELWLGTSPSLADGRYIRTEPPISNPNAEITVYFPRADIEALGDGTRYFAHRLYDALGNVSVRSDPVALDILLVSLPRDLKAPVLPTRVPGLLTYNDITPFGPLIQIPPFTNPTAGDDIWVTWGPTRIGKPYRLTDADLASDPLAEFYVDYAQVLASGNADGLKVSYEVYRGITLLAASPTLQIDVNLDVPGDEDPIPETPENENLQPLVIRADSGAHNIIDDSDYGKDVTAIIPRARQGDARPVWKVGDRIHVQWGADPDDSSADVDVDAGNEAQDIEISLPASLYTGVGVGTVEVRYIITRALNAGSPPDTSTALSPARAVQVISKAQLPGGGSLVMASFPEEIDLNRIDHESGRDGTTIEVPLDGVANVGVDDQINLRFVGIDSLSNPDAAEIPGTEVLVVNHRITEKELNTDRKYVLQLTPTQLKAICRNGSLTTYSISNRNGSSNAERKFIRIAVNQGDGTCNWQ